MSDTSTANPAITDPKKKCPDLHSPPTPTWPDPKQCPQPCCCPPKPGGPATDCLLDLITAQSKVVKEAETAKLFVEELGELQKKAASARAEYTQAKYESLVKIWKEQDAKIADLIQNVECVVKCWECLLECRLCTLLYDIRALERKLNGTGTFPTNVDSLRELHCWHERNRDARKLVFERIKGVLAAWENPAKILADILEKNGKLIEEIKPLVNTDQPGAVYRLFVQLIPMHWAIRPTGFAPKPATPSTDPAAKFSAIAATYIDICKCDDSEDDSCCGPNTGAMSLRLRLIGPQPSLVDPGNFMEIICCLATERYLPAKNLLAKAEAEVSNAKAEIDRIEKLIKDKTGSIEKDFQAELTTPIDCSKYWKKTSDSDPCTSPPATSGPAAR